MAHTESLFTAFPAATRDAWESAAQESLKGRPLESLVRTSEDGLRWQPIHLPLEALAHRRLPTLDPALRGACVQRQMPWGEDPQSQVQSLCRLASWGQRDLVLEIRDASPAALARWDAALATLELTQAGAGLLVVGADPAALGAWMTTRPVSDCLLVDVAGAAGSDADRPDAAWFRELASLCQGPLAGRVRWRVSSWPLHEAGATRSQELGGWLSMWANSLRQLERQGLAVERALALQEHELSVAPAIFESVAGLRAARLLAARFLEALGLPPEQRGIYLSARGSTRSHSRRDPWTNALRVTLAGFAAQCAGVDALCLPTVADGLGSADEDQARLAFNTQEILKAEGLLAVVEDPARGSGHVEELTLGLAQAAWERFQHLEAAGGWWEALARGLPQAWIQESAARREQDLLFRRKVLVGCSRYADPAEIVPNWAQDTASQDAAPSGQSLAALRPRRLAVPLEVLRARGEACVGEVGLVALGSMKEYGPRVDFCREVLAVGGLRPRLLESPVEGADAARLAHESGLAVVVLCGQDEAYAQCALDFLHHLRQLEKQRSRPGAMLLVAGRPSEQAEALEAAGCQGFLHLKAPLDLMLLPILKQLEDRP